MLSRVIVRSGVRSLPKQPLRASLTPRIQPRLLPSSALSHLQTPSSQLLQLQITQQACSALYSTQAPPPPPQTNESRRAARLERERRQAEARQNESEEESLFEDNTATGAKTADGTEKPGLAFDPRKLIEQGIPATAAEEFGERHKPDPTHALRAEDPVRADRERGGKEHPKSQYVSSTDRKRERLAAMMLGFFMLGGVGCVVYLGRNWETPGEIALHSEDAPNGWGPLLFYNRIMARLQGILDYYNLPNAEKLLPEPPAENFTPYTLVLSLEDMLVHSEWTREHGWRTAKRPGVDYFLTYMSQYYELVIFTSMPSPMASQIIAKLDPYHICIPLFRESTKYKNGRYIKDLSYLGRDLSKVIMVDTKPDSWSEQPRNAIKMKPWQGNPGDKELVSLIPFLEYTATTMHSDVREVLASYPEDSHIPTEFARREAVARAEFKKRLEEERKSKRKTGVEMLMGMLGISPKRDPNKDKMRQDVVREIGKQNYEDMAKNLRENGDYYLEMDRKAQEDAMAGMKTSLSKIFTEGLPQPPALTPEQMQQISQMQQLPPPKKDDKGSK